MIFDLFLDKGNKKKRNKEQEEDSNSPGRNGQIKS